MSDAPDSDDYTESEPMTDRDDTTSSAGDVDMDLSAPWTSDGPPLASPETSAVEDTPIEDTAPIDMPARAASQAAPSEAQSAGPSAVSLEAAESWAADASVRRTERLKRSEPRRSGASEGFRGLPRWARYSIAVPAAMLLLVALLAAVDVALSYGRVHPRVSVSGVPIGMMTRSAAEKKLSDVLGRRLAAPVTALYEDKTWEIAGERLGIALDPKTSVDSAMAIGSTGPFLKMVAERSAALFRGTAIEAKVDADPAKITGLLDEIDGMVAKPASDAKVQVDGLKVSLIPATLGLGLDRTQVTKDLLGAFASQDRVVELNVDPVAAHVSDADAQQALADAKTMISAPVSIAWEDKTWTIKPPVIANWLSFRNVPFGSEGASGTAGASATATGAPAPERMTLQAYLETSEVSSTILPLAGGIGRPPVDAKFVIVGGKVTVSGGQTGLGPDIMSLATDLETALRTTDKRSATLRLATLEPPLTAERAKAMGIVERISTYTTTYPAGAKDRVNNIHTLANALNDKLVAPGAVFDFNAAVGERTAAKGYREAPAIVNGKLVPQLGGGICQIGTTFFNTVFFSGLPVVERRNHSFYISHYPKGRDCTVTWGGPNLRWKNETASWILIKASYTNSSVTIALYGTDPGYSVDYTTSAFSNIRAHKVIEVLDPTLKVGARVVEDGGVDGANCTVVRTVTKGVQVVRTDTFVSYYKPKEETVRVGTKGSVPPTSTPTP
jgi:vancomycin resistance protein YoaR